MKFRLVLMSLAFATVMFSCKKEKVEETFKEELVEMTSEGFEYSVEQFADLKVLRYQIPGWENLTLKEQKLVYYLTQAGLAGRDIMWDQNYKHNLAIRKALENVYTSYEGDKTTDDWKAFELYLKRVWFSNGIHHHYSTDKIKPGFNKAYLEGLLKETNTSLNGEALEVIFNDKDVKKETHKQQHHHLHLHHHQQQQAIAIAPV